MRNEFELAFNEIKNQRALPQEVVLEALKTALISAYRRYANASAAQEVDAVIDPATGRTRILVEKEVVTDVMNPLTEVSLEKARFYNPEAQVYDMVMVEVEGTTKKFGRIAAQTAKQVILQKIREAERNSLYDEYRDREGDIVTGTVQNVNNGMVTISLGRAEAVMPRAHQIPGERHRQHDKLRVYVVEVKKSNKGPQIIVSRSHRNMLKRLLEFEVPEIYNGQVEIKSIAREAGHRSKVAVAALQEGVDPVGACVGMRGMRIQNIVRELKEEKIDVIEWQQDPKQFISKALSPARVTGVYLDDDPDSGRTAVVVVPDDQLSLAIGREGQNARLAAKLTGWRIDIKSEAEAVNEVLSSLHREPYAYLYENHPSLIDDAQRIMAKRDENRTIMPEEYQIISQLANLSESRLMDLREEARQARLAEIEAVKATIPSELFEMPIAQLNLHQMILDRLETMENVGEIMWRFLIDEQKVGQLLTGLPNSTFDSLKAALDEAMMSAMMGDLAIDMPEDIISPTDEIELADESVIDDEQLSTVLDSSNDIDDDEVAVPADDEPMVAVASAEQATPAYPDVDPEPDELPAAFPMDYPDDDESAESKARKKPKPKTEPEFAELIEDFSDADDDGEDKGGKKKGKRKRRQLVYDENAGRVVSKRKRKGSRSRDDWEDYID